MEVSILPPEAKNKDKERITHERERATRLV